MIFTEPNASPYNNCPFSDFECLEVTIKNDLQKLHCNKEGKYKRSTGGNISPSWINFDKNQAIWWISNLNAWGIGDLYRDDSTNGYDTRGQNFYVEFHYEFQKMTLILIVCLQKIYNFEKLEGCSSIIEPATSMV